MTWLTATPLALVRSCARMLPRLEAEESILEVERLAMGVGRVPAKDARDVMNRWTIATGASPIVRAVKAPPGTLASFGIGMRVTDAG